MTNISLEKNLFLRIPHFVAFLNHASTIIQCIHNLDFYLQVFFSWKMTHLQENDAHLDAYMIYVVFVGV